MDSIVITGANEGIGFWMVNQWLEDGYKAAVFDKNTNNLQSLAKRYPETLFYYECDVTNARRVLECASFAQKAMGSIDIAIHNACLCKFQSFDNRICEDTKEEFEVNYFGAFNLIKAVLPFMRAQHSGKFFVTSSAVGITGFADISGYASTKGALESLMKCLRLEYLSEGISFRIIHPPLTDTKSSERLPVPKEFKASAEKVGRGIAKRIFKNKFITTPSFGDALSVKMCCHMPIFTANLLDKMTRMAIKADVIEFENGKNKIINESNKK
jgi:NAD(P)-dependent dehydrogenase (short-subunit alcohol dehydrogenase family)